MQSSNRAGEAVVLRAPDRQVRSRRWPLERVLFGLAGTVVLASALLAALVSPWFLLLTVFVGVSQWSFVLVGACPASVVLERIGIESACGRLRT